MDTESHRAYVQEEEVLLTALEFKLLLSLMSRAGRVQSREPPNSLRADFNLRLAQQLIGE